MSIEREKSSFLARQVEKIKKQILIFNVLQKKDPESFGKFYDLFVAQIYRFIYFKVLQREAAEDLTAETFLKTWQYLIQSGNERKNIDNLQALLYRIARNCVVDFYRLKNQEGRTVDLQVAEEIHSGQEINSAMAREPWSEEWAVTYELERLLPLLKDLYREVIMLRFVEQLSIKEIASIIGKSKGHVRVIIHRGLLTLKESVKQKDNSPAMTGKKLIKEAV